jgi:hypothetical protein
MKRYEIRTVKHPNGIFGIWDREIQVWQSVMPTREEAEAWITVKELYDKQPRRPTRNIRMPLRD